MKIVSDQIRRKKCIIDNIQDIESIIRECNTLRLGMCSNNQPYVVPVSFGYESGVVYIHCALIGKKMDIIRQNPNVCVEFDIEDQLVKDHAACNWTIEYRSVLGFGKAEIIENTAEKLNGLSIIMKQYSEKSHPFDEKTVSRTAVIKITLDEISGKTSD